MSNPTTEHPFDDADQELWFFRDYCADVYHLVKERQRNLISPKFWFYFLATLLIPRVVLRRLVGIFKDTLGNQHASRKIPELTEG